jgi:rod shape-determining protein MreC
MLADVHYNERLHYVHDISNKVSFFINTITYKPRHWWDAFRHNYFSISNLQQENSRLREESLQQQGELHKLAALEIENDQLRAITQAAPKGKIGYVVAAISNVTMDPYSKQIIIDQGSSNGIVEGQVVADATGIVGSVVQVAERSSKVLLLTDPSHAIPVESLRSGVRSLLSGSNNGDYAILKHLPNTVDIKVGDILVTSGLGGKYPFGYPVGKVIEVDNGVSQPFAKIKIQPTADLAKGRFVLVLQKMESKQDAS